MSTDVFFREYELADIPGVLATEIDDPAAKFIMRIYSHGEWHISGSCVVQAGAAEETNLFDLKNEQLLGPVKSPFVWLRSVGIVDHDTIGVGDVHTPMTFYFNKQLNTVENGQVLASGALIQLYISGRAATTRTWPINMIGGQNPLT